MYNDNDKLDEYFELVVWSVSLYPEETVYFISYAKLPGEIPAANVHKVVGLGMIIHRHTGEIVDVSCTLLTKEASDFLKAVLIGKNVHTEKTEAIVESIRQRYHGFAQKALCVAAKATIDRYFQWKESGQDSIKENI